RSLPRSGRRTTDRVGSAWLLSSAVGRQGFRPTALLCAGSALCTLSTRMIATEKWTLSTFEMETSATTAPPLRSTYRHGDLRRASLEAGVELARHGGPDAVVLREATRRAGVVPNAAYRHFASRDELLRAVRSAALSALAVAIETELAGLPLGAHPADSARGGLRAVGTAYLRF